MADETLNTKKIYMDARRLAWFASSAMIGIMLVSLFQLGVAAVPILTAGVSVLGMLAGAYAAFDKWLGVSDHDK